MIWRDWPKYRRRALVKAVSLFGLLAIWPAWLAHRGQWADAAFVVVLYVLLGSWPWIKRKAKAHFDRVTVPLDEE